MIGMPINEISTHTVSALFYSVYPIKSIDVLATKTQEMHIPPRGILWVLSIVVWRVYEL